MGGSDGEKRLIDRKEATLVASEIQITSTQMESRDRGDDENDQQV
ncbi:MAG: hypothetical protein EYC69_08500 [Bacteroidetes bacterium]|nr:MAG: hypothetical protein EYC69_08500 [Bacteroidota bacterium]